MHIGERNTHNNTLLVSVLSILERFSMEMDKIKYLKNIVKSETDIKVFKKPTYASIFFYSESL